MAFLGERRYDTTMIQTMVDRFKSGQLERYFTATLLLVALGSMIVSLMIGLQQSVWFDEAYSVFVAKQPVLDVIYYSSVDVHPPFYYLLLKVWAGMFGWGELALRSLSVLAMGGAVVLSGLLLKRMFGVRVAIMALPFIALSPLLLRFGFEIRMYAMASLIGIAATYVLVCALEMKTRSRQWRLYALYALLIALGGYTSYLLALLWSAHLVWLVCRAYRERRPIVKTPWFVALVGGAALFAPWVPVLVTQIGNGSTATVLQQMTLENLAGIVSFAFLYQPVWQLDGFGTILLLFIGTILGVFVTRAFKKASKKERDYLWLLVLYLLVPVVVLALVSLMRPIYIERYISHVAIGGLLLFGVVTAYSVKKASTWTRLFGVILYAMLLLGVGQLAKVGNTNYQQLQKPSIGAAAQGIGNCHPNTTILAADPYVAVELSYYLSSCEIRFYSASDTLVGGYAPLANSSLRIAHPADELANSSKLQYIYYGKPRLTMPSNLVEASHDTYGSLNVDTFVAE